MSDPAPSAPKSFVSPFRHAIFRNMWVCNLASNFGGMIQMTGAAWLMTQISHSNELVAFVQASVSLPVMFFSLLAGAIADIFNRRRIMLVAQSFMFTISVLLVFTVWLGWITPWMLLSFTFLIGCGTALMIPAWQASVQEFVPREELAGAVTLNSAGFNLSRSLAPALGGVIVASLGAVAAFATNALSYIGIVTVLFRWKPNYPIRTLPPERITSAMSAGLRYVAMSPNISKICVRGFVFGFMGIAMLALLPLVARDLIHGGARSYGLLLGAFGFGGVVAALCNARIRVRFEGETIIRFSFIATGLALGIVAFSGHLWLGCFCIAIGGACWVWVFTLLNVSVQLSTPRWVLARALAIYQMASAAGFATGSWTWGYLAEHFETHQGLIVAGIGLVIGAFLGFIYPIPKQRDLNLSPFNHWTPPPLSLDLKPSSGPIIIQIEYIISEEDIPEFLRIMNERRRIRLRDGASNWTLMRSLEESERWTMSYQLPTWVEYVRHNQRMTQDDASIGQHILKLHAGEEPPLVRRMIERHTDWSSAYEEQKPISEVP